MDVRTSKLVVVSASVIVFVVTVVAFFGVRQLNDAAPRVGKLDDSTSERRTRYDRLKGQPLAEEKLSKRRLRELLDQRTRSLNDRSAKLHQVNLEHDKLKAQFADLDARYQQLRNDSDENTTLLVDLVAQFSEDTEAETDESLPQLPQMQLIDVENGDESVVQDAELTLIQWQLDMANERVRELENTILREMVRSSEASRALVEAGAAAVPALTELLADANADVRLWAAEVLGRIGRPALDATDGLIRAMSDSNQEVRDAAESALDRIEGRS